jgi:hypothetical protein
MTPKENMLRVIRHDNPEWVPRGLESVIFLRPPIVERPAKAGFDDWGVEYDLKKEAQGGTFPMHGGFPIKDFSKWREQLKVPDVESFDWKNITIRNDNPFSEEDGKWIDVNSIDRDSCIVCGSVEFGLFERSWLLMGMEEAFVNYFAEPDEMRELIRVIADYKIAVIKKFNSVVKLDMIWYGDDWGHQKQLFLSPEVWKDIIKPETKRIYDCMKELGIIINQHSCGRIEEVFGDMVEIGVDIYNPCQPCNNLFELKRKYGDKVTFCGGLDSQFVLDRKGVTPEEVRAEVRSKINGLAKGGGYIATPSHDVPYTPEVMFAMKDEIEKCGRYKVES